MSDEQMKPAKKKKAPRSTGIQTANRRLDDLTTSVDKLRVTIEALSQQIRDMDSDIQDLYDRAANPPVQAAVSPQPAAGSPLPPSGPWANNILAGAPTKCAPKTVLVPQKKASQVPTTGPKTNLELSGDAGAFGDAMAMSDHVREFGL